MLPQELLLLPGVGDYVYSGGSVRSSRMDFVIMLYFYLMVEAEFFKTFFVSVHLRQWTLLCIVVW
jgi:hypothetical protein